MQSRPKFCARNLPNFLDRVPDILAFAVAVAMPAWSNESNPDRCSTNREVLEPQFESDSDFLFLWHVVIHSY